ncbi:hypothetical protein FQZ97_894200 [compost metagenome]
MQHAVGTETHPVRALIGFEVQVRRAAANGVQQHLVDETNNRGIVGIHADCTVPFVIIDRFDIHAIQVDVTQVLHAASCAIEELLDGIAQLVVFHQDGFGVQAGTELDIGYCLVIGRVGNGDEQLIASAPEG